MKNRIIVVSLIVVLSYMIFSSFDFTSNDISKDNSTDYKILILTGDGFGHSVFPLMEEIKKRGWSYFLVGVEEKYSGCYNQDQSITLTSDLLISKIENIKDYQCLIVPSGPQFRKFIENEEVKSFIKESYSQGLVVCSYCAGNVLINACGLLGPEGYKLLAPDKIIEPKPNLLIAPRGGGPAKTGGNGYKGLDIVSICDAIEAKLKS